MFAIPNLQQALVKVFMDIAGYNNSAHPAVRLVDMYITDHPKILTYSKYVAAWALLNVLTVLFTLYIGLKLASFAIWLLACSSVRMWEGIFNTVMSIQEQLKEIEEQLKRTKGKVVAGGHAEGVHKGDQAKGVKGIIEKATGQDISHPPWEVPACATRAPPKQQAAATAAVDLRVHKRSVIYEWDTSEDEASIISS